MPNGKSPTREEIKAAYEESRQELGTLEQKLIAKIREINKLGPNKTDADKKQRDDLQEALRVCQGEAAILAQETVRALDKTGEIKELSNKFVAARKNLEKSLERVKHIQEIAATT